MAFLILHSSSTMTRLVTDGLDDTCASVGAGVDPVGRVVISEGVCVDAGDMLFVEAVGVDTASSRKNLFSTGFRGLFLTDFEVLKPPPFVPVPYKQVLKVPPRGHGGARGTGDLWYRFVTRTSTKGYFV
jgi:hypothetical protein